MGVLLPIESQQGSQRFKTQLLSCSGWHKHASELGATGSSTKLKLYQSQSSVFTRDGTKQNTWLVHASSRYRVSLAHSGFTTAQMKVHLLRLVAFRTNRRIHAAQRRWWGGVRGLLPAKCLYVYLSSSYLFPNPPLWLFSRLQIFLSFAVRPQLLVSWSLNARPLSPLQRNEDFIAGMLEGVLAENEKDRTYCWLLKPRPPSMIPHWALNMATRVVGVETVNSCSLWFEIIFK